DVAAERVSTGCDVGGPDTSGAGLFRSAGVAVMGGRQLRSAGDRPEVRRGGRGVNDFFSRASRSNSLGGCGAGMPRRRFHLRERALTMPLTFPRLMILAIATLPSVYYLVAIYSAWRHVRTARQPTGHFTPAVSVLKPVRGLDPASYE